MRKILLAIDIGNVCVKIDFTLFPKALGLEQMPDAIKNLLREFEFGHITEAEFCALVSRELGNRFSTDEVKNAYNKIIIEPVPGMVDLVNSLPAKNIQAIFLSDISPTHLQRTRDVFGAFDAVAGGIFSFKCGNWKPSEEMLGSFEKQYGKPDLYVDDRMELITGARERGWNAQQFIGAEDLREKLAALS